MRLVSTLLAALLLLTLGVALFGRGGHRDVAQLRAEIDAESRHLAELRRRNDALRAEVDDLRAGGEAIEGIARRELGMVREGETFMQVLERGPDGRMRIPAVAPVSAGNDGG